MADNLSKGADEARPVISVIVPAYLGEGTIKACLAALRRAVQGWNHEIIVVESSGDGAADIVRRCYPQALILSPLRLSAGQARHEGARLARGRWLFYVDQGCLVPEDWVRKLKAHLAQPGGAASGGSIAVSNPHNWSGWAVYFLEFLYHFPRIASARRNNNFLIACNSA